MLFRVTSVACEDVAAPLRETGSRLEGWLAATLADGDFGTGIDQFSIMIVSVSDDQSEDARWLSDGNKLGSFKTWPEGSRQRYLSVAVWVEPSKIAAAPLETQLSLVCAAIVDRLATRPARLPKGLDFVRLAKAVCVALKAFELAVE